MHDKHPEREAKREGKQRGVDCHLHDINIDGSGDRRASRLDAIGRAVPDWGKYRRWVTDTRASWDKT